MEATVFYGDGENEAAEEHPVGSVQVVDGELSGGQDAQQGESNLQYKDNIKTFS